MTDNQKRALIMLLNEGIVIEKEVTITINLGGDEFITETVSVTERNTAVKVVE